MEQWDWIIGFEGKYQISTHGRVRSVARYIGRGRGYFKPEAILKSMPDRYGYLCVSLALINRKTKLKHIHKEAAKTFICKSFNDGYNVCHLDGDKTNNNILNLYVGDHVSNTLDKYKQGRTKLTIEQVREIRDLKGKLYQYEIAKLYNIRQSYVSRIFSNIRCQHIPIDNTEL